jgi:D-alanyl-D-alanine carboxypeptidase/D-alanyl-D-alanine-endopeptidase (penicillin-binding protein 4)
MFFVLLLWAFGLFCCPSPYASTPAAEAELAALIENGGYILTRSGETISSLNPNQFFIPASTIKIATAFLALEMLGPSRRIKTEFYLRNTEILCIKGYGDPYLTSERVEEIARTLKDKGVTRLEEIIVDDSHFNLKSAADGSLNSHNPYDAENGALAVNFNTVPLIRHDNGQISSPEPQTPVLAITRDIGSLVNSGLQRVNVSAFKNQNNTIGPLRYAAELFAELLRRQGIEVMPSYRRGKVSNGDRLLYTYYSKSSVSEMMRGCLNHSNNYIANQLFLISGAVRFGPPATWDKGRRALTEILVEEAAIAENQFRIIEGSGLSRKNRITPAAMIRLLEAFRPYASLLRKSDGVLLKSGTMDKVYGYGGYFSRGEGLDPFVILLNQPTNSRAPLLKLLSRRYGLYREDS